MTRTRVIVADDHPTFRRGFGALLDSLENVELVGEAADGEAVVALAAQLVPDVVVMDLNMPGVNGVEATRRILGANPDIAVLVLTMLDEDESVFAAMRAGARGYVVKGADTEDVLRALESWLAATRCSGRQLRAACWPTSRGHCPPATPSCSPNCPTVSAKCSSCWLEGCRTARSPARWSSPPRPSATT